jgi:hypothetical protein
MIFSLLNPCTTIFAGMGLTNLQTPVEKQYTSENKHMVVAYMTQCNWNKRQFAKEKLGWKCFLSVLSQR